MATKIRLCRMGARNNPFYRLVVADSRFATTGRNLEVLGWYDPKKAEKNFSVKLDRVDYWAGTGAQVSATAKSLIKKARAGEGVEPGAAPAKAVVVEEAPAAEVAADEPKGEEVVEETAPAAEEAPASAEASADEPAEEAAPAEDSEKQES